MVGTSCRLGPLRGETLKDRSNGKSNRKIQDFSPFGIAQVEGNKLKYLSS